MTIVGLAAGARGLLQDSAESARDEAIEMLSGRPVVAVTINHEQLTSDEITAACADIERTTGRPAFDVLCDGADDLAALVWRIGNKRLSSGVATAPSALAELQFEVSPSRILCGPARNLKRRSIRSRSHVRAEFISR